MPEPRIFVNIASYRDTECQWTVRDMFEKAAKPDRLGVGICWQFVPEEDADCFLFQTRPEQCRVIEVDARESLGACWARHKCQSLWQGEEYTLQIDSHMRFVQDWDDKMLEMLAECDSPRPLLSSYPPAYIPPDQYQAELVATIYAKEFSDEGILKLHSKGISPKDAPTRPERNPFCAGGFLFGSARIISEIRYDPYLYFHGEEISLAARLWTSGWDVYSPNRVLIWHDYSNRPARPRHWHDHQRWTNLNTRAFKRLRHLFGIAPSDDPEALTEIEKYGLGAERSLADYESFAELDFRKQTINGKTQQEREAAAPPAEKRARTRETFTSIWEKNGWGNKETRSGAGSTLASTGRVRAELSRLFPRLGIEILADAGCGDLNWITRITGDLRLYLGFEVVEELVREGAKKLSGKRGHFISNLDVSLDDLPRCDAILCRDVLTHLPTGAVEETLARFKASGSRFLIATTFPDKANTGIKVGQWQPINLCAAPFDLPPPFITIRESESPDVAKSLGVWALSELP